MTLVSLRMGVWKSYVFKAFDSVPFYSGDEKRKKNNSNMAPVVTLFMSLSALWHLRLELGKDKCLEWRFSHKTKANTNPKDKHFLKNIFAPILAQNATPNSSRFEGPLEINGNKLEKLIYATFWNKCEMVHFHNGAGRILLI